MHHPSNFSSVWNKYFVSNVDYDKKNSIKTIFKIIFNTLYSKEAKENLEKLITDFKPDIAHLHNFHHQLSPSVIFALRKYNIPIVAKLPDYKLICPSYSMLNRGKICELCNGGKFYNCVLTRCHKNSFGKSFLVTIESYLHHNILNTYKYINYFLCPSRFLMNKVQEMGLTGNFIYLPNFVDTHKIKTSENHKSNKFVYWGRLSITKGIITLIKAIKGLPVELVLIGDGPLISEIELRIEQDKINNIKLCGYLQGDALYNEIRESCVSIIPSEWYENNPNSVLESFALGLPVIGSKIGGIPELVKEGITGLTFEPGNVEDLRNKIEYMLANKDKVCEMGRNARRLIEEEFNAEKHGQKVIEIYQSTIGKQR